MVIRRRPSLEAVTQPAHALVAGQMGRAWGNEAFPRPSLFEELVYAADQHDIGHMEWERAPTLDLQTGLPHTFKSLPCEVHLRLWRSGVEWMIRTSRFAALMISQHATGLYQRHFDREKSNATDQRLVRDFLAEQRELQRELTGSLASFERYSVLRDETAFERYSLLLGTWDLLSLLVCESSEEALSLPEVPADGGLATLNLRRATGTGDCWQVNPWPFQRDEVLLHFESRRLNPPYRTGKELHADLDQASPRLVEVTLVRS